MLQERAVKRLIGVFLISLCVACVGVRTGVFEGADLAPGNPRSPDLTELATLSYLDELPVLVVSTNGVCLPIVVADDDRFVSATFHLAATIERMTGFRPSVLRELQGQCATNAPAIYIGSRASQGAGFSVLSPHPEAFRVVCSGGSLHFLGRSDFAVYDFCERILNERIYSDDPEADADLTMQTRGLAVPGLDYSDEPVFEHRIVGFYGRRTWGRMGKVGSSHRGKVVAHAPAHWFADTNLVEQLPEIFALTADGVRAASPQLCYGNPRTLAYYKRRIEDQIAGLRDADGIVDPERRTISISPWDAAVDCRCADCQRLRDSTADVSGTASALLWADFARKVAEWARVAHPDYLVCILPYLDTCCVPKGLDFTDVGNVEAMVCTMPGLALFKNGSCREREEKIIRDWAAVTGRKVLNWHYVCWPAEFTDAPYVFGNLIREHYQRMRDVSAGSFVNTSGDRVRFSLSVYVWMRCLWDPSVDVEAIYDEFARRMFGPAAHPMRRLIALQEKGWSRAWPNESCLDSNVFGISYPPDVTREMRTLLESAWQMAEGDAPSRRRIAWYASGFARFFRQAEALERGIRPTPLVFVRSDCPILVDGERNEPAWSNAPSRDFVSWDDEETSSPKQPTTVRTLWTQDGMFFAFDCQESSVPALDVNAAMVDDHNRETLKLLLAPPGEDGATCLQFLIDLKGRVVASRDGREIPTEGVRAAVRLKEKSWTAEVFVPFAALGLSSPPLGWKGNLIRWRIGDGETEWTRLSTRGICRDLDRNAFTTFEFVP